MTQTCETVTIKTPVSEDNPTGIVVINATDFDAETMVLFTPNPIEPEPTTPWAKTKVK